MKTYLEVSKFAFFEVEGIKVPKVILGHNPFLGLSYLSAARAKEYQERFSEIKNIVKVISKSIDLGVPSIYISPQEKVIQAIKEAREQTGADLQVLCVVCPPPPIEEQLKMLEGLNLKILVLHGAWVDKNFDWGNLKTIREELDNIRRLGFVPGLVTHRAGDILPNLKPDMDIQLVISVVNMLGWRMEPCSDIALRAMRSLNKPLLAIKTLAMGRITPRDGIEYALKLNFVKGIVVGIASVHEAEEDFQIAQEVLSQYPSS